MWQKHLKVFPKNKLHCSNLGADALHIAIKDYETKKEKKAIPEHDKNEPHTSHGGETCYCPYCDTELESGETYCKSCQLSSIEDHRSSKQKEGDK